MDVQFTDSNGVRGGREERRSNQLANGYHLPKAVCRGIEEKKGARAGMSSLLCEAK